MRCLPALERDPSSGDGLHAAAGRLSPACEPTAPRTLSAGCAMRMAVERLLAEDGEDLMPC